MDVCARGRVRGHSHCSTFGYRAQVNGVQERLGPSKADTGAVLYRGKVGIPEHAVRHLLEALPEEQDIRRRRHEKEEQGAPYAGGERLPVRARRNTRRHAGQARRLCAGRGCQPRNVSSAEPGRGYSHEVTGREKKT